MLFLEMLKDIIYNFSQVIFLLSIFLHAFTRTSLQMQL